jgi:hypothetical protein
MIMDPVYGLSSYLFIGYFVVAWLLYTARSLPGNTLFAAGFTALGVPGLVALVYPDFYYYDTGLLALVRIAGVGALLIGAWQLARGAPIDASGTGGGIGASLAALVAGFQTRTRIPRNETNSITRAEALRDTIADRVETVCAEMNVPAEVFRSPPYHPTAWVRVVVSVPDPSDANLTLRTSALVTIERHEFYRYDRTLTITLDDSRKTRTYRGVATLLEPSIHRILAYMTGKTESRNFGFERIRVYPWQLWRPKNKLTGLKTYHNWALYSMLAGVFLLSWPLAGVPLLLLGGSLAVIKLLRSRRIYSVTAGKPKHEPRILLRMDSWQTALEAIGPYGEELRADILQALRSDEQTRISGRDAIQADEERVWYDGIDGKEERNQIVARLGRAIAFIHVYPYGDNVYVGWDAHINGGTWSEQLVGQGVAPGDGRRARAYGITSSWHTPNEYDIADGNFLIEWVHAVVTRNVKRVLKDHEIDQEIDFTIVRESRQTLAGRENPRKAERKMGRFQRVA